MTYLVWVAGFGALVTYYFWARDLRIFLRTGLPGYRKAVYHGLAYATLALIALDVTLILNESLGLGLLLLALYLQGREKRERVFTPKDPAIDRILGRAPRREDKERGTE
ncbi:MAG TPA: ABC transporter permease [Methanomicrobiales archaeon]|nr:ABC transporter permease [Methanomicrobiales archaeon]